MFDSGYDTYESLHERSPFAFDAVCMVAAKVRDGGGECPISVHCSNTGLNTKQALLVKST